MNCLFDQYIDLVRRYQSDPGVQPELDRVRALLYQQRDRPNVYGSPLANVVVPAEPRKPRGVRSMPRKMHERRSINLEG